MNLMRWSGRRGGNGERENAQPLTRFRGEMDRLFDRFFQDPWRGWNMPEMFESPVSDWAPAVDVAENDSEISIRAEVPGVSASDINVSVTDNVLTITGEKSQSTEEKDKDYFCCERTFGSFRRSLTLPSKVDVNKIAANYADGVLSVRVPKPETAKPHRVEVKSQGKAPVTAPAAPSAAQTKRVPIGTT